MRTLAIVAAATGLAATATATVSLTANTHTPKVNVRWPYVVRATHAGKPLAARLTAQLVDPLGGAHFVQYGSTKKNVKNWRFRGVFRDYLIFPGSSRGIPLTFRVTVTGHGFRKVISYRVTPRG